MKKCYIFAISLVLAGFISSCTKSQETLAKDTLEEIRQYFPYSENQTLVYVNDSTAERISFVVSLEELARAYPYFLSSPKEWEADMDITLTIRNGGNLPAKQSVVGCHISNFGQLDIMWFADMALDKEYSDTYASGVTKAEMDDVKDAIDRHLTEVVIISSEKKTMETIPQGQRYVRILKHKGLTDFSLDGHSAWHLQE